ncbi:helix-turn-helix transcriptional regulator [Halodesulfovibrio aestuarii]|uniref:Helix-turn-helix transcriptional regulator n=2 Tax=Halodesulfovibrio aestuarii TaxID=126333 RepID=A0ABV4JU95_9BACT
MNETLHGILKTIITTESPDYLWENFISYTKHMGVAQIHTWFSNSDKNITYFSTLPDCCQNRYIQHGMFEYDQVLPQPLTASGPLLYGYNKEIHNPLLCKKARELIQMATSEFNYGSGITMPSFYNNKCIGGICICFPETVSQLNDVPTDKVLELLLVTCTAHERLYVLTSKNTHSVSLTPRQQECLTCLACGLNPQQIADKIGISHHTVKMHIDSAKERLGATTRIQAVAKALTAGLITIS